MTVKADLQKHHGVKQRLFLQIDGHQPRIWQDDGSGTVPSWDTTGILGLQPPTELSMSLDITTMKAEAGAMTFELLDIKDTDGLSYWGQKIAPSAWDAVNAHWRINVGSAPHTYVDANADTIPLKDATNYPAAGGTFYVGQETISTTGQTSNVIQGVTKGLYPIVSDTVSTFGQTYLRPQATDAAHLMHVGTVPFTWHGRRVALKATTMDTSIDEYHIAPGTSTIFDDQFSDASIGPLWTTVLNYGTVVEAAGDLTLDINATPNSVWTADYKKYTGAYVSLSDIGMVDGGLICVETSLYCNQAGPWSDLGIALYEDDENMVSVVMNHEGSVAHGKSRIYRATDNVFSYSDRHATDLGRDCLLRLYWNSSTTETFTIVNSDTIAPGRLHGYFSDDGGTTWVTTPAGPQLFPTTDEVVTIVPNAIMVWGHGGSSTPIDVDFQYVTITQTIASGTGGNIPVLLWAGRISNTIQFSPKSHSWKLSCESIMADLEREVAGTLATANLKGINLMGDSGRTFTLTYIAGSVTNTLQYTVPKAWYKDAKSVAAAFNKAAGVKIIQPIDGVWSVTGANSAGSETLLAGAQTGGGVSPCHALGVLGFTRIGEYYHFSEAQSGDWKGGRIYQADGDEAVSWHPVDRRFNGGSLYVDAADSFWPDQGDDPDLTIGWVTFKASQAWTGGSSEWVNPEAYGARTTNYLSLSAIDPNGKHSEHAAAKGFSDDDENAIVSQIYRPTYDTYSGTSHRGVFEAMLFPLLSTGTSGYNHATYDKLPLSLSVGIQSDLVDSESFLAADRELSMAPLTERSLYVINEGISYIDLLNRECMLYGYALVWNRGKLRLKDVTYPSRSFAEVTVDESCRAIRTEKPDTDMPVDTVVNHYAIKAGNNIFLDRRMVDLEIGDADSIAMFGEKTIEIDHPGAFPNKFSLIYSAPDIQKLVSSLLLGRPYRFPSPIVEVSLAPFLLDRVYPGDVVLFTSTCTPDPLGTGLFATSQYALVIDASWNYVTKVGSATLLIMANYNKTGLPWCPAALVTGYADSVITLSANEFGKAGDPDDGSAFISGDAVLIIERAAADPAAPKVYARTLSDDYGDAGTRTFTLSAVLADYDATKQYVMVFGDYADVVTLQQIKGSWQAAVVTELIDGGTAAYRYG